jgi:hypothetical protein
VRLVAQGDAVGADHRGVEGHDALHVGLVHQEVDGGAGLQPARRLGLRHAPFGGDVGHGAAHAFGVRHAGLAICTRPSSMAGSVRIIVLPAV